MICPMIAAICLIFSVLAYGSSVGEHSLSGYGQETINKEQRRPPRWRRRMGDLSSAQGLPSATQNIDGVDESKHEIDETGEIKINAHSSLSAHHVTKFLAECQMPSKFGKFMLRSYSYTSETRTLEPIVLIAGDVRGKESVIVRVHDQCFTSEVFGSMRCDCREQLQESMKKISKEGGIIIYLQQEGRGIGLANKIAAYSLQDIGFDTVSADQHLGFNGEQREYFAIPDILADLDIHSIRLITNNPYKINQMKSLGIEIVDRISMEIPPNHHNLKYLISKRDKMAHMLDENLKVETLAVQEEPVSEEEQALDLNAEATPLIANRGYAFGKQSVEAAIQAIKEGKVVVVVDDEDRENEGDLIMAAEHATPETVGFIVRHSSGVLCISMESSRLKALKLPPMVVNNEDPKQTAYTISVDYKHGTTTGISAADRAATFKALADPSSTVADFQRPGHVFPLRYKVGGVLARAGHTEASLDLTRLAGLYPAGVLAEIVNDDGSVARLPALRVFAAQHGLVLTSVQDLIAYRYELESSKNGQF